MGALCLAPSLASAQERQLKNVLLIYSHEREMAMYEGFDAGLRSTLQSGFQSPIDFYAEYLDLIRFPDERHRQKTVDYLRVKYAGRPIDLIVVVSPLAFDFVRQHAGEVYPGVPIVFTSVNIARLEGLALGPNVTGIAVKREITATLDLALRLQPDTVQVAVPVGTSAIERTWAAETRKTFEPYERRVAVTYFSDLDRVKDLPPHTIILLSPRLYYDAAGRYRLPEETLETISRDSNAPVYGTDAFYLGGGIVGGNLYDLAAAGVAAGRLGQRILAGEAAASIPVQTIDPNQNMFDARQLQRWGISENRLPAGAIVAFREPSLWDRYKLYMIGTISLVALQSALIAGLLVMRARRRRAERALRRSEDALRQEQKRHTLATAAGGVGVWDWNIETNQIYVDPALKAILGFDDHEIRNQHDDWCRYVHPDDVELVMSRARTVIDGEAPAYEVEHRMVGKHGQIRWFLARGSAVRGENGKPTRVIGTDTDITDRKQTEDALRRSHAELNRMARFTALGEFAASIAHEVNQPLTAIGINAKACLRWLDAPSPNLSELREALRDVASASGRASEVIKRTRELVRHHTVEKETLDLNAAIREISEIAHARLLDSQLTLRTDLSATLPPIRGDRVALQQVLLNLVVNAVEAMGGVDPASRELTVSSAVNAAGDVLIAVRDSGVGLAGVDLESIFRPLHTTKPDGMGMGLAISRSIISAHGGRLWAAPNDGAGATFFFTVPVDAAAAVDDTISEKEDRASYV